MLSLLHQDVTGLTALLTDSSLMDDIIDMADDDSVSLCSTSD